MILRRPKLAPVTDFVARHKTALTVVSTATVTAVAVAQMQKGALAEAYEFIDARGLTTDFIESYPLITK